MLRRYSVTMTDHNNNRNCDCGVKNCFDENIIRKWNDERAKEGDRCDFGG